ncbi:fatty acyl-AMP ligase [Kangiella sp.]|uniref:fatty acyl-AMP ligase n=1 Tax=Kangiella sp. TaxID=1920245 RepID=UPI003A8C9D25
MINQHDFCGGSLIDLVEHRAKVQPDKIAYIHLKDRDGDIEKITYIDFERRVKQLAAKLQEFDVAGERIVLMYPPGIDYTVAYFAVIFAGAIAVPVYEPRQSNHFNRIERILADCQPKILLTKEKVIKATSDEILEKLSQFGASWLTTDSEDCFTGDEVWKPVSLSKDSVVFLQYTSGSTGNPKGVMVTNGNLLHNSEMIRQVTGQDQSSCMVTWLPPYHDMGLIGGLIQPMYTGYQCVILSPISVIQRPIKWLNAIRDYKGTISGGPNFIYEACVKRVREKQLIDCDLSSWQVAFNGAEPINADTVNAFSARFEQYGFRHSSHLPCYGMAETTLMVSSACHVSSPIISYFDKEHLQADLGKRSNQLDAAVSLVSSGKVVPDLEIKVVDPENAIENADGQVGEIWVKGDSIALGYWQKAPVTGEDFVGILDGDTEHRYLRTGDLGFIDNQEVFITGRIKDLIIIRGKNHYPQDIEATITDASEHIKPHSGAAFSVELDGAEKLVVMQEIDRRLEPEQHVEVKEILKEKVAENHGLQLFDVKFIRPGTLPKTTSGKIQRRQAKKVYLDEVLANALPLEEKPVANLMEEL